MASMKRPRLQAVQARPDAILELNFTSDQQFTLDMSKDLKSYPGLKPLSKGNAFQRAALGDAGWTVEWPDLNIQIGADTLYRDCQIFCVQAGNGLPSDRPCSYQVSLINRSPYRITN